jgi:ubiquinone/menaquinone biosynthesis C-methylase UbiE
MEGCALARRSFTDVFQRLLHRIVAKPAVYDFVQWVCGAEHSHRKLRALTIDARDCLILDVGAGTGNGQLVIPEGVRYLWLDDDRQKLTGVGQRGSCFSAVLASATAIPLASKSVDIALCIAMSHHIDDIGILDLFGELARVCRERLIFLDPVLSPKSLVSRVLWKYDRGSHPRSAAALRSLVHERFEITHDEEYTLYHRYWLCAAKPRI